MPRTLRRWPTRLQLHDLLAKTAAWLLIAFMSSFAPLCACHLAWVILTHNALPEVPVIRTFRYFTITYSALEVIFALYYYGLAYSINKETTPASTHSPELINAAFLKCMSAALGTSEDAGENTVNVEGELEDLRVLDFREFLRYWFHGARFEDITRTVVLEWLAWSLYNQHYPQLLDEVARTGATGEKKVTLMDECFQLLQTRGKWIFPNRTAFNLPVRSIRLTLDPFQVLHRPLFIYLLIWAIQEKSLKRAHSEGFVSKYTRRGTRYLIRVPAAWRPDPSSLEKETPLVFLHGLGCGLGSYATFVNHLSTNPALQARPLAVIIQPHVSMAFFDQKYLQPPDEASTLMDINEVFELHGFHQSGVTLLSHSNGSVMHSWIVKAMPDFVRRSGFIDPICFCLWEPYVCYNFLHRPPSSPIEILLRYFVARELGIAQVLQRAFSWSGAVLFPSDVPRFRSTYHTAFFLAEKDEIINASRVHQYLLRSGVPASDLGGVKMQAGRRHGGNLAERGVLEWVVEEPSMTSNGNRLSRLSQEL